MNRKVNHARKTIWIHFMVEFSARSNSKKFSLKNHFSKDLIERFGIDFQLFIRLYEHLIVLIFILRHVAKANVFRVSIVTYRTLLPIGIKIHSLELCLRISLLFEWPSISRERGYAQHKEIRSR